MTRADNPLTARVIVNRLWQHHFGRGIVATPNDFGVRGEPPSHPLLLDWLAVELVENGWRLKPIHRMMVCSATYRQASSYRNTQQSHDDPENILFWRMKPRRREAEALRDAMLAVTGELNDAMNGPGVRVPIEQEIEDLIFTEAEVVDLWPETLDPREHRRRSLYLYRKRNVRYAMFDAFDAPDTQTACARRDISTHALQALVLLNSAFAIDRAKALSGRLYQDEPFREEDRIRRCYQCVLSRAPTPREQEQCAGIPSGADGPASRARQPRQPQSSRPRRDRRGRGGGLGGFLPGDAQLQRIRLRPLIDPVFPAGGFPRRIMMPRHRPSGSCPGPSLALSRRDFLRRSGAGFGLLGLSSLLQREAFAADARNPLAARPGHFPAKAKRCIFLFMVGGPSHIDLFDPKPALQKLDGQSLPESFGKIHSQFLEGDPLCLGSHRSWSRCGQSGMDMSDLIPHMHQHADEIALIRSCHVDSVIHAPAHYQMNSGRVFMGHPSLGSWVTYGLGSESENLPAFVVMTQPEGTPEGGAPCWGSGFLPASYQGTLFRNGPAPIINLKPATEEFTREQQRATLDLLRSMNEDDLDPADTELSARIASYELAFRMQAEAPEAVDLASEPEATKELYGLNDPKTVEFGTRCLLSRRLVERGVRFVQLYSGGGPVAMQWDAHDDIDANHEHMCGLTDKPVAALLTDLKRTGLLDETLVIWGGEFGRTPVSQGGGRGRDHNATGFTMWMAGAGVKGGTIVGSTDEIGLNAIEDRAHVNDLHATILHLMGLDHKRLTFLHNARDERLTDVGGRVLTKLLA